MTVKQTTASWTNNSNVGDRQIRRRRRRQRLKGFQQGQSSAVLSVLMFCDLVTITNRFGREYEPGNFKESITDGYCHSGV